MQVQVEAAPGLVPNSLVSASKGRAASSSPTKKASKLEPQPPAKVVTRAMPRSPSKGPHTPALHEAATIFSRASAHSPAVRVSSPTAPSKGMDELQDGKWCEPRRCSCCWASTKASGSGSPLQHLPGHLQDQDIGIPALLCGVGSPNCPATQYVIGHASQPDQAFCATTVPATNFSALHFTLSTTLLIQ